MGARFLDPRLGSFNSGEPLLVGSPEKGKDDSRFLSVYSYAHQNPQRFADPDGKDVIILVGQPNGVRGYDKAALKLQAELKQQNITAHIVTTTATKLSAVEALRAQAAKITSSGEKVGGLVYIGHGDLGSHGIMPKGHTPVSVTAGHRRGRRRGQGLLRGLGLRGQRGEGLP